MSSSCSDQFSADLVINDFEECWDGTFHQFTGALAPVGCNWREGVLHAGAERLVEDLTDGVL
jgi:hypothetical protein